MSSTAELQTWQAKKCRPPERQRRKRRERKSEGAHADFRAGARIHIYTTADAQGRTYAHTHFRACAQWLRSHVINSRAADVASKEMQAAVKAEPHTPRA